MGTVIVITSGKGGTGKSSFCGGLGVALAELSRDVLCIDADIGLRNLDIALGMADSVLMDFSDVMEGHCPLARAAAAHPSIPNLSLLTAPLSLAREEGAHERFAQVVAEAKAQYDFVLIDSPAGLGLGFSLASCAADEAIIVSMNDLSSVRDAQRVLTQLSPTVSVIRLVLNRVRPRLFRRLGQTADDVMDALGLPLLGLIPEDAAVLLSSNAGRPLLQSGDKGAAHACRNIARRITGQSVPLMKIGSRGLIV